MSMDMNKMLQQVQQMQEQMVKAQAELANETVEASAGGGMVTVKATGGLEVTEIKISPEALAANDAELLEDTVLAAVNEALIEPRTAGAGLYVICDGTVVVDARGMERELGPGEVVGEISLLEHDGTRRARVTAKTAVRCLALGRNDFEQLASDV